MEAFEAREGDVLHGFRVSKVERIEEFDTTAFEMVHEATGAAYLHLARPDTDNAFAVAFRTPPNDSTGVAHILEHTTLCGSEKYPVRDPFFHMLKRSLKTFMNAMTGGDYTTYPFSTQNKKDFMNLLDVYLDATFFPRLRRSDFAQEGHRLEFESPSDPSSPLQFKGVVFNEMKGEMSDGDSLFYMRLYEAVFSSPDVTFHHNSGGEPAVIPDLTYDQLVRFHRDHYTPSNAVFCSYGTFAPPLEAVSERVLRRADSPPPPPPSPSSSAAPWTPASDAVALQPRADEPRRVEATCPEDAMPADPDKPVRACVSFLCNDVAADRLETFGMSLLSLLLVDGPSSPMHRALIEPGIGSDYSPVIGYDAHTREAVFTFGLRDIAEADVPRVERLVHETLASVARDGFPPERVEAIMHQLELSLKSVRSQFGLGLVLRGVGAWLRGQRAGEALRANEMIEEVRRRCAEGPYFQELVRKWLTRERNPHCVTFVMRPDARHAEREAARERRRLDRVRRAMTEADERRVADEADELQRLQTQKPDSSCLPSLAAADIEPLAERAVFRSPAGRTAARGGVPVERMEQPTNGLVYVRGLADASGLPAELRPYLTLWFRAFGETGAGDKDYRQLSHALDLRTGGVYASHRVVPGDSDVSSFRDLAVFGGSALERNVPHLAELLGDAMRRPRHDDAERMRVLLSQQAAAAGNALVESGHSYARTWAASRLHPAALADELGGGLSFVRRLSAHASAGEAGAAEVASRLAAISEHFAARGIDRLMVTATAAGLAAPETEAALESLAAHGPPVPAAAEPGRLGDADVRRWPGAPAAAMAGAGPGRLFVAMPMQVNHSSMCVPTVPYTHEDSAPLTVLAEILSSCYLHREIRERGGAYGGGAGHSTDGVFSFYSYRDPASARTLDTYSASAEWVAAPGNVTERDVEESLLSVFSRVDSPVAPSAKGVAEFVTGRPHEARQQYRDRLLAVTRDRVAAVAEQYLAPDRLAAAPAAVFGNQDAVPEEVRQSSDWEVQSAFG